MSECLRCVLELSIPVRILARGPCIECGKILICNKNNNTSCACESLRHPCPVTDTNIHHAYADKHMRTYEIKRPYRHILPYPFPWILLQRSHTHKHPCICLYPFGTHFIKGRRIFTLYSSGERGDQTNSYACWYACTCIRMCAFCLCQSVVVAMYLRLCICVCARVLSRSATMCLLWCRQQIAFFGARR